MLQLLLVVLFPMRVLLLHRPFLLLLLLPMRMLLLLPSLLLPLMNLV